MNSNSNQNNKNTKYIYRDEPRLSRKELSFIYQVAPNFDRYRNETRQRIIDDYKLGSNHRQNHQREDKRKPQPLKLLQELENVLIQRIWFEGDDQSEYRWQAGEYCGICRNKSRPSEEKDSLCECVRKSLEDLKKQLVHSYTTFEKEEKVEKGERKRYFKRDEKDNWRERRDERRDRYSRNWHEDKDDKDDRRERYFQNWRDRKDQRFNQVSLNKIQDILPMERLDRSLPPNNFDDVYDLSFPLSEEKIKEIKSIQYWKYLLNYINANPKELKIVLFFGHSSVVNHRFLHLLYIKRILTQEEYEDYTERYENWGGKYDHITSYSQLQKELDDELDEIVAEREDYYYKKNQKRRRVIKKSK